MTRPAPRRLDPTQYIEIQRLYRRLYGPASKPVTVITSSTSGEGSTLLTHLLALCSADSGHPTLVIDFNCRQQTLTQQLALTPSAWPLQLSPASIKTAVQPVAGVKNLYALSAPLSADHIAYCQDPLVLKGLLQALGQDFSRVLIDTTPLDAHNRQNIDAALIASVADQTILVALTDRTPQRVLQKALRALRESGAVMAGVVLNNQFAPHPGQTLAAWAKWWRPYHQGLSDWLQAQRRWFHE